MRSWRIASLLAVATVLVGAVDPGVVFAHGSGRSESNESTTSPVSRRSAASATEPAHLELEPDSVPGAGWFHVGGFTLPTGTAMIRYSNVDKPSQVGLADHPAGPLSFWFRAPGPPGSTISVRLEALNGMGGVIGNLGSIELHTGNAMLPLPPASGTGKRMVIHSDAQQVWLVEADGTVTDTFLMSGRRVHTASGVDQTGVFRVYSRSRTMRYCDGRCGTAPYMVRYQRTPRSAVGTHGLPVERGRPVQGADDLGWPLSHGCTRLDDAKALEVYRWATVGTVVIVF